MSAVDKAPARKGWLRATAPSRNAPLDSAVPAKAVAAAPDRDLARRNGASSAIRPAGPSSSGLRPQRSSSPRGETSSGTGAVSSPAKARTLGAGVGGKLRVKTPASQNKPTNSPAADPAPAIAPAKALPVSAAPTEARECAKEEGRDFPSPVMSPLASLDSMAEVDKYALAFDTPGLDISCSPKSPDSPAFYPTPAEEPSILRQDAQEQDRQQAPPRGSGSPTPSVQDPNTTYPQRQADATLVERASVADSGVKSSVKTQRSGMGVVAWFSKLTRRSSTASSRSDASDSVKFCVVHGCDKASHKKNEKVKNEQKYCIYMTSPAYAEILTKPMSCLNKKEAEKLKTFSEGVFRAIIGRRKSSTAGSIAIEPVKATNSGVFSVYLVKSIEYAAIYVESVSGPVPVVIVKCVERLRQLGLNRQGLMRESGSIQKISDLKKIFNDPKMSYGLDYVFKTGKDEPKGNDIAGLLKKFLVELPEPLFPASMFPNILACQDIENTSRRHAAFKMLLIRVPLVHLRTICYLFKLLNEIHVTACTPGSGSDMRASNLSICLTPSLLRYRFETSAARSLDITKLSNFIVELITYWPSLDVLQNSCPYQLAVDTAKMVWPDSWTGLEDASLQQAAEGSVEIRSASDCGQEKSQDVLLLDSCSQNSGDDNIAPASPEPAPANVQLSALDEIEKPATDAVLTDHPVEDMNIFFDVICETVNDTTIALAPFLILGDEEARQRADSDEIQQSLDSIVAEINQYIQESRAEAESHLSVGVADVERFDVQVQSVPRKHFDSDLKQSGPSVEKFLFAPVAAGCKTVESMSNDPESAVNEFISAAREDASEIQDYKTISVRECNTSSDKPAAESSESYVRIGAETSSLVNSASGGALPLKFKSDDGRRLQQSKSTPLRAGVSNHSKALAIQLYVEEAETALKELYQPMILPALQPLFTPTLPARHVADAAPGRCSPAPCLSSACSEILSSTSSSFSVGACSCGATCEQQSPREMGSTNAESAMPRMPFFSKLQEKLDVIDSSDGSWSGVSPQRMSSILQKITSIQRESKSLSTALGTRLHGAMDDIDIRLGRAPCM